IQAARSIIHGNSNVDQAYNLYKKLSAKDSKKKPNSPNQNKSKKPNSPNQNKSKKPNSPNQNKSNIPNSPKK
ncbi:MAG: 3-hydroxy-5-phosphonooxypentane-2,4-dione thiolase, partial [Nitrosopumilus sp.]|nr:3-hydroxy-5-phosphonooxypentane-2,4-dione thiolase [Nitrosopumilus sp.]